MTFKIVGACMGRTGTNSLKLALEQLGYDKTHHMFEMMPSDAQIELWKDVGEGKDRTNTQAAGLRPPRGFIHRPYSHVYLSSLQYVGPSGSAPLHKRRGNTSAALS